MQERRERVIRYQSTTEEYLAGIDVQGVIVSDRRPLRDRKGQKTGRQGRKAVLVGFNRLAQSVVFIPLNESLPEGVPYLTSRQYRKTLEDENYAKEIRQAMKHARPFAVLNQKTLTKSTTTP